MSQSAEQAALGNVHPDGNSGVKRQVSADAFRALTMRLNGTATPVVNPVVAPVSDPSAIPVIAPVQLPELAIEPTTAVAVETRIEPINETPPVAAVLPEPQVEFEIPSLPITPDEVTPIEVTAGQVVEQVAVGVAPEPIAVEPVADNPVVEPSPFAMPSGGTKIILNASVTAAFKSKDEEKHQPEKPQSNPVELIEAIRPDNSLDTQPLNHSEKPSVENQPSPVGQPLDPLLAAMNLVQSSEFTVEIPDVALVQKPQIDDIEIDPAPESAVLVEPLLDIEVDNHAEPVVSPVLETEPVVEAETVAPIALEIEPETVVEAETVAPLALEIEPETVESFEPTLDEPTHLEPLLDIEFENHAEPAVSPALETEPVVAAEPVAPAAVEIEPETAESFEPALDETALDESTQPETIIEEQPIAETIAATTTETRAVTETTEATEIIETTVTIEAPQTSQGPIVVDALEPAIELEPDAQSGETARALLDMMSSGSQPQERALAADTLLQLVPRMMVKDLVALSERVCMMENPPTLLVSALINHSDSRVAAPLLQDGYAVGEQELLRLIADTKKEQLIMMAKRRKVSSSVCDALIFRGEPSVYLTLVRNPGAALSHDAFVAICEIAKTQFSLQAPLATRSDTPPPIAFELFWCLPIELRRYILSRFLTDSGTLDKILKLTQSVDNGKSSDHKFPPQRKIEELVELIADGVTDEAAVMLAKLAGCNQENARRVIADPDGEPLAVVFKAMGLSRSGLSQAIKKCASSSKAMLRSDRNLNELQILFDSLSFNKARTLLTYWDWAIEKTGPYARRVM